MLCEWEKAKHNYVEAHAVAEQDVFDNLGRIWCHNYIIGSSNGWTRARLCSQAHILREERKTSLAQSPLNSTKHISNTITSESQPCALIVIDDSYSFLFNLGYKSNDAHSVRSNEQNNRIYLAHTVTGSIFSFFQKLSNELLKTRASHGAVLLMTSSSSRVPASVIYIIYEEFRFKLSQLSQHTSSSTPTTSWSNVSKLSLGFCGWKLTDLAVTDRGSQK